MANVKRGNTVAPKGASGWWRHLRRVGKRMFWKQHRAADKRANSRE